MRSSIARLSVVVALLGAFGLPRSGGASLLPGQTGGPAAGSLNFSAGISSTLDDLPTTSLVAQSAAIPANLGDLNDDSHTNNFDIKPFELALSSPSEYLIEYPAVTDYANRGDINRDGAFNDGDSHPLEILLTLGIVVSEPPAAALLAIGCVGLLIVRCETKTGLRIDRLET